MISYVSSDECMIEVVEPQSIWILPLGNEIIEDEAEGYVQMLVEIPKDSNKPRIGIYAEKSMEVHLKHKKPIIRKNVEKKLREPGYTSEEIAQGRA